MKSLQICFVAKIYSRYLQKIKVLFDILISGPGHPTPFGPLLDSKSDSKFEKFPKDTGYRMI